MKVNTLALHGYDSLIMNNMAILNKWNWDPIYTVFALSYIQTIYSFHIFFFFPINILIPHCALSIGYYGTVTWQYQNTGDSDGWDDLGGVPSTAYDYAIGGDYSAAPLVGQTLQFRARTSSGTVLATSATYTYTEHQIQVRAFPASLLFILRLFTACSLLLGHFALTSFSFHLYSWHCSLSAYTNRRNWPSSYSVIHGVVRIFTRSSLWMVVMKLMGIVMSVRYRHSLSVRLV